MTGPLQVVFFGTSPFGIPALQRMRAAGHEIAGVVTQPDRPRGRGRRPTPSPIKRAAAEIGCPVLQPERVRAALEDILRLEADVGVVAAYGQFLPTKVIEAPRLGSLNIHGSVLPRYRGAAPIQRAVMNGDAESGVTIFRIVRKMDAGPILATRSTPIGPDETAGDLEERLSVLGAELLVEVLADLPAALAAAAPQDESAVTFAPRLAKEEGHIDFDAPAGRLRHRVRGLHPWPGAFADLVRADGPTERLRLLRCEMAGRPAGEEVPPGTVLAADDEGVLVACREGALRFTHRQRPGGKPLDAAAFLRGHAVRPGDRLA